MNTPQHDTTARTRLTPDGSIVGVSAPRPGRPSTPATTSKRTSPGRADRRFEIVYCPQCGRQLTEGEYSETRTDIVMTTFGGLTTTVRRCTAHPDTIVTLGSHFVVRGKGEPE